MDQLNDDEALNLLDNPSDDSVSTKDDNGQISKIITMVFFLAIDLALNCSLDYDKFNDTYAEAGMASRMLLGLVGVQIVVQISIFLVLFLAMADTFLFRVGLLGILLKKFKKVLFLHPIYIALTLITGIYRVKQYDTGKLLFDLWTNPTFIGLSYVQKFCSIPYYILNIRASMKLGDPIYFDNKAWIELVRRNKAFKNN